MTGYTDCDWGGSLDDRRSTSGNLFKLGLGAITWNLKKQDITALSTTVPEYVAASTAACQAVWLKRLLSDMGESSAETVQISCDNKSAIFIAKIPALNGRTKHIDIKFHLLRSLVADGSICLKFCSSEEQIADICTKALPIQKHLFFKALLGVHSSKSRECVEAD